MQIIQQSGLFFKIHSFLKTANRRAHIETTGPEIWEQTHGGQFDAFTCATGTGGTFAGVSRYLKEVRNLNYFIYLSEIIVILDFQWPHQNLLS